MKLLDNKKIIHDGVENQELYSSLFSLKSSDFKLSEIVKNNIEDLKNLISKEDFLKIVKQSNFQTHFKDFDFGGYQSEEGLSIYYIIKDCLLYIFSFGEYQPARYMLYIESVWEL